MWWMLRKKRTVPTKRGTRTQQGKKNSRENTLVKEGQEKQTSKKSFIPGL